MKTILDVLQKAGGWPCGLRSLSVAQYGEEYSGRNRIIPAHETFDGTFPFSPHFSSAAGFRMHYVDEGSGPDTLLMLHGEPPKCHSNAHW